MSFNYRHLRCSPLARASAPGAGRGPPHAKYRTRLGALRKKAKKQTEETEGFIGL